MYYTKYRPQKFSEVAQPNDIADALAKQVASKKTVHAYLFVGSRGTGKTTMARVLAKALNCEKVHKNGDPCGECANCVAIRAGAFADLFEIDAASNRGIDDIRDLRDKVRLAPTRGKFKLYIIDEVHMLTSEAFNALLKTLEEPPRNVVFILCTTEAHKVPETIKSRCQVFRFKRATVAQLVTKLSAIAKTEGAKIKKEDIEKIAASSMGAYRDAETLLQQVVEGGIAIETMLSLSSKASYASFIDDLYSKSTTKALKLINKVYDEGVDLYLWVGELQKYIRDLLYVKSTGVLATMDETQTVSDTLKKQAGNMELLWLVKLLEGLGEIHPKMRSAFLPQLPVELFIVKMCADGETERAANKSSNGPADEDEDLEGEDAESEDNPATNKGTVAEAKSVAEENLSLNVEEVKSKWTDIISKMKSINSSVMALLKSVTPLRLEANTLVVEVYYAFHKERMEATRNRMLIENTLRDVLGQGIRVKYELSKEKPSRLRERETGNLTDFNISPVNAKVDDPGLVLDVFDGGLPL